MAEDIQELLKALSNPKESLARLEALDKKKKEVVDLLAKLEARQEEVAKQGAEAQENRTASQGELRAAEAKLAEAKRVQDAMSIKSSELEARNTSLDAREKDLKGKEEALSVLARVTQERDAESKLASEKVLSKERDLARRLGVIKQAGEGL